MTVTSGSEGNLCNLLTSVAVTVVQPDNSQQEMKRGSWEQKTPEQIWHNEVGAPDNRISEPL